MPRIAVIEKTKCKPELCGWVCQKKCPINMTGADCIYEDNKKAGIDEILCTGCGICPKICPFDAIEIINLPELKSDPIHQYGPNGFRIFNLPMIQEGSIIGILGRNGIGKSTVINVLSKTMEANFAKFGADKIKSETYFESLKQEFKGTVLQNYFTKLEKGEIKVAYKPQQITNIPKMFSGVVKELLLKVNPDEKQVLEVAKQLNVIKIIDREIKVLSGGELQRVAIAAALLRDANFYIFDEITNYLDIYERLNSSRFIKEHCSGKTALVVEHDLVVLDYLIDSIHIMYGQPSAFGMLTGVKAAKVGLNDYLEGYSKEENVRFRDKPITFDKESDATIQKIDVLTSWEEENIEVGTFKLNVKAGNVKRGETIGIIGQNALGKSTFMKHIVNQGLGDTTLSYKAQLIERSDNIVMAELAQFGNFTDSFYETYVLNPLNIKPLLEKQIDQLSGGELQRYALAKCLLADADIYLLDEPTAFLDIEDRLKIAKMLKYFMETKQKSAFIIDHDLVFMDYLSDNLLVFEGEPSIQGTALPPMSMRDGMNTFLKNLEISFRRDEANKRPRVNKLGSVKDQEQKKSGEYYYA
ncbi:MAG: ribosome biogenesis/translation initiation ATPase RLI [Nanoarchaeota archaeon]|nr:ribosome biogenesis/translation initiation ATPase RLI [Nanoarchaeota archaeon]